MYISLITLLSIIMYNNVPYSNLKSYFIIICHNLLHLMFLLIKLYARGIVFYLTVKIFRKNKISNMWFKHRILKNFIL